jgi:glycosyltransferase involved in cell wall biosynthesis
MTGAVSSKLIELRLSLQSRGLSGLRRKMALTYDNARYTDGVGAQLQRIYGIYSISRLLDVPYIHTPLSRVDYQGMAALEENVIGPTFHHDFNNLFHIQSDEAPPGELQELRKIYLSLEEVRQIAESFDANPTGGRPYLIRLAMPYHISDDFPECYEICKQISPFPSRRYAGRPLRVAIHVRRGELLFVESHRMLPNAYYVSTAQNVVRELGALGIDYRIEIHTEAPKKQFVVGPELRGIGRRMNAPITVDPAMCSLDDFSVLPNLVLYVNETAIECLRKLATADILIMSRSSFSYVAAILNRNAIALFRPFWHPPLSSWIVVDAEGQFNSSDLWAAVNAVRGQSAGNAEKATIIRPVGDRDNTKEMLSRADEPDSPAPGDASFEVQRPATIFVDVTDLLLYLRNHTTLSGIQRVQCEIARNLIELGGAANVGFVALDGSCNPHAVETTTLLDVIGYMGSAPVIRAELDRGLDSTFSHAGAPNIRQGDTFISIGAFWGIRGEGLFLQTLKNSGVKIGLYIHDILNVTHPEYFKISDTKKYVKGFVDATTYADFFLTTSQYNKASLIRHLEARWTKKLPVEVVPLGHELWVSKAAGEISGAVADIANSEFVLSVGTIEVRKNPTYLFNIWKMMIQAGRKNIPKLVLAGRTGWLVQDFIEQLNASDDLGGRIVLLHDATDVELALLYRKCILTMFPSFAEGWGLPVGESIAHGKICIASNAGGIPEVAGEFADYVDPYNASDGLRVLLQYLDDPDLRRRREREIADRFKPRPWRDVAEAFLKSVQAQAGQIEPFAGVAAIKLPPNRFLPITSDGSTLLVNPIEGDLSADLICISGWRMPEMGLVRAEQPKAAIRFRTDAPAGTGISLLMRLRGTRGARRVRIRSGSGTEATVVLNEFNDSLAVLPCEVEPHNLVSAVLSLEETESGSDRGKWGYWALKGILYVSSERRVDATEKGPGAGGSHFRAEGSMPRTAVDRSVSARRPDGRNRIAIRVEVDETGRAASLDAFLSSADSFWPLPFLISHRDAPIFADHTDKKIFYDSVDGVVGPTTEKITLVRRSDQHVSMLRFSEGCIFDSSGVSRGLGYFHNSPAHAWLSRSEQGTWIGEEAIAAAPCYDKTYLIFYNGNLHNYYHWVIEGLLPLHVLSQTFGPNANLNIALPRSRHINAVLDHRESLRAVGLDGYDITEVAESLIKVREAVWVEPHLIQSMPASYLKDFQSKVAALYSRSRLGRKRRLLVARKVPTRMIHNLRQVRSLLSKLGFETVYLEGMSIMDQIVLFQNAEFVISPHGAGLSNLLFCDPGTKVIELMPAAEMRPYFWLISEKLGLVHGMLFCAAANGKDFQASVDVDIDKLDALYRMVEAHY